PDLHMFRDFFIRGVFELLIDASPEVKDVFGFVFEGYIERLITSFAPRTTLVNTYFSPVWFVGEQEETCDGILAWNSIAVLMECKTNILTSRQRYAMLADETVKAIDAQLANFKKGGRKGVGQLGPNIARIIAGAKIHSQGQNIDLSTCRKLYPALIVSHEVLGHHAVRVHLQRRIVEWFEAEGIDRTRIGHVLLFTIRDMEMFELLAHPIGAEK